MLHEARMIFQRTIVNQAPRFPCRGAAQFNEAMHRMSGHHVGSRFERSGRPLIGDLGRWVRTI
jgi:hypothetical protein